MSCYKIFLSTQLASLSLNDIRIDISSKSNAHLFLIADRKIYTENEFSIAGHGKLVWLYFYIKVNSWCTALIQILVQTLNQKPDKLY